MKDETNDEDRNAVSGWEDEGGALPSEAARRIDKARAARDRRRPTLKRLDESHQSDMRGEHRYEDQTEAEQDARQERDDLKQRLARLLPRRVP